MPTVRFFIDAIFLGVALSMDAFSISVANGLCNQNMSRLQAILIPSTFAFFQLLMPLVGWICVKTVVSVFEKLEHLVPIIAMIVLAALGIKMLIESFSQKLETCDVVRLDTKELLIQGIATSLDALSVGFTIAEYSFVLATVSVAVIGAVTFVICALGVKLGKLVGFRFSKYATFLGGSILIIIGVKIFLESVF